VTRAPLKPTVIDIRCRYSVGTAAECIAAVNLYQRQQLLQQQQQPQQPQTTR